MRKVWFHRLLQVLTMAASIEVQAVCALGSLIIMGGIKNLIICVKMARSEHLAGGDCGDKYSLNTLQKSAICLYFLPETSVKTKAIELSGENSVIPLISVLCSKSLSHESTKGKTLGSPEKMISSSDQCNQNYEVLRRFLHYEQDEFKLKLENLVRLCMVPSDKIAVKQLPRTIREFQRVSFTGIQVSAGTLFGFVICFTICIYHT